MTDFNTKVLDLIDNYKKNFALYNKQELYKWEAVKHFQDNFNLNATNLSDMLKESLSYAGNLLSSVNYYPYKMITLMAEWYPQQIKKLLEILFFENMNVADRLITFGTECNSLIKERNIASYQDTHAMSVYLAFRYPDKYYIYKNKVRNAFVERTGYIEENLHKDAKINRYLNYQKMCNKVHDIVIQDKELLAMTKARLNDNCFEDSQYRMLTMDIVYSVVKAIPAPIEKENTKEYYMISAGFMGEKFVEWTSDNYISLGSMLLDDIRIYDKNSPSLKDKLIKELSNNDNPLYANKYAYMHELFYRLKPKSVVLAVNGKQLLGIAEVTGDYYYDKDAYSYQHRHKVKWLKIYEEEKPIVDNILKDIYFEKISNIDDVVNIKSIRDKGDDNMTDINLNTILFGPPGTGKTYNTAIYAVAIIENKKVADVINEAKEDYNKVFQRYLEYKNDKKIDFVTFHQSYGYEEFVEGIKPENDENGELKYEIQPGIFKRFCDAANTIKVVNKETDLGINKNPNIWKVSLEKTGDNPTRNECLANGHIRIGWDQYGDDIENVDDYKYGGKIILDSFYNKMEIGDIVLSCYNSTTTDAIGVVVGDAEWDNSYSHLKRVRKVKWLVKNIREDIININNEKRFTTGTLYKLNMDINDVLNIVKKHNKETMSVESETGNYVFIIDEINRGNISKIFGELITLVEGSKRRGAEEATSATLPYSKKPFSIPKNVYILGTMNTADRSIAHIDTALRRRFDFVEMMPDAAIFDDINVDGINIGKLLRIMNKRIAVLYDREHTIGHAYFMPLVKKPTMDTLADIFAKKVVPLLQEYFFDDYKKIRLVLGDNNKGDTDPCFISEEVVDLANIFGNISDIENENTYTYHIDIDNFNNKATYEYLQ